MAFEITEDTKEVVEVQENDLIPLWSLLIVLGIIDAIIFYAANLGGAINTVSLLAVFDVFILGFVFFNYRKITMTLQKRDKKFRFVEQTLLSSHTVEGKFSDIVHVFHKKRFDATAFHGSARLHSTNFRLRGKSRLELLLENDKILILNRKAYQEYDPWKTQYGVYEAEIGKHIAKFLDKPFIDNYEYA